MFTISQITEKTELDREWFDKLFIASFDAIEAVPNIWAFHKSGTLDTVEEKNEALFDRVSKLFEEEYVSGFLFKKGTTPIHFMIGFVLPRDPDYFRVVYTMMGPDSDGSKGWYYDETTQIELVEKTRDILIANLGVKGVKAVGGEESAAARYQRDKSRFGFYTAEFIVESFGQKFLKVDYIL